MLRSTCYEIKTERLRNISSQHCKSVALYRDHIHTWNTIKAGSSFIKMHWRKLNTTRRHRTAKKIDASSTFCKLSDSIKLHNNRKIFDTLRFFRQEHSSEICFRSSFPVGVSELSGINTKLLTKSVKDISKRQTFKLTQLKHIHQKTFVGLLNAKI